VVCIFRDVWGQCEQYVSRLFDLEKVPVEDAVSCAKLCQHSCLSAVKIFGESAVCCREGSMDLIVRYRSERFHQDIVSFRCVVNLLFDD